MTVEEAMSRAAAVFVELERTSPLFEDTGWMNKDDKEAIIKPIADAILAASVPMLEPAARCPHPPGHVSESDDGYLSCHLCGESGNVERCGICNRQFCICAETGMR